MMRTDQGKLADPRIDGDRLSSLPDEILTHILSSLQTKYAVSTSVLSRRWKDLWTRVSIIDLDNQSLDGLFSDRGVQEARDLEFSRFVRRVLSKHKNLNSLMRFHLAYCSNVRPICLSKIELNAASQLEEIVIKLPYRMRKLPRSFYTLKNLKVLKLSGLKIITAQGSVFLPSLKVLELWRVETVNGKALSRLITGCPVLETVHLEECYCPSELNRKHKLTASLPFLKNLTIIGNLNMETMLVRPVVIEAARLEHLQLENFDWLEIAGNCPLSCLESARLGMREEGEIRSLIDLLAQVSNAKQMWLSSMTMVTKQFALNNQAFLSPRVIWLIRAGLLICFRLFCQMLSNNFKSQSFPS
ncbi:unnamed protein product [Linum tenue]|uniref:F-box domain-containing protein n=1 Tax=Linum tenue TaxID=586396 RepID=A0AAV0P2F3_9ROSI|nr:unnamed protein product [Linum tenue]